MHKWLQGVDWDKYAKKQVDSPVIIDFYNSNIHQEFLDIDVDPDAFLESEDFELQVPEFNFTNDL